MPSNSREDSEHDSSSTTPSVSPLTSLISQVFAIPRAIYERGVERGDGWRQRREQHNHDDDSGSNQRHQECSWRRQSIETNHSASPKNASHNSPLDYRDEDKDDWVSWIKREAAQGEQRDKVENDWISWLKHEVSQGEQRAKEMYDSWEPTTVSKKEAARERHMAELVAMNNEIEKSHERPIQELLDMAADMAVKIAEDTARASREISAEVGSDPFLQSILRDFIPHLFAVGTHSWDPEDASSVTSQLMSYATASPYSPIHLEQQPGFDKTWRARFEDLIRAETGQPLLTEEEIDTAKNQRSDAWLRNLVFRSGGIAEYPSERPRAMLKNNDDAETELDAYHKFTDRTEASYLKEAIKRHRQSAEKSWPSYINDEPPDNIATVTSITRTVDRYTESDGSSTTKTVVHRKFHGGREETTENVEKFPAPSKSRADPSRLNPGKEIKPVEGKNSAQESEQSRRGWFWSK